jgi:hypothetical protein
MSSALRTFMPYIPYIAGLAAAAIAYIAFEWLLHRIRVRGTAEVLERFAAGGEEEILVAAIGSDLYKVRLAFSRYGMNVADREGLALWAARILFAILLTLFIWWAGFPPLTLIAGPALAWLLVGSLVEGAWTKMRREIENEIPTFLSRMSGTVQAEPNVLIALEDVTETLIPEGPLRSWMRRFLSRLSAEGRPAARPMLEEAEAISPSLGLAIFEVLRLWETGGEGYARAFARAAENLMGILDGRVQAYAKAAGAKSAIRVVLGALILVSIFMLRNPEMAATIRNPLIQIAYLVIAVWVAIGWYQINSMIEEAVQ